MSDRPTAAQLLDTPGGMLSRRHLRELGWERRAIDSIFRELDVVFLPDYTRGAVRVEDYLALLDRARTAPTGCGQHERCARPKAAPQAAQRPTGSPAGPVGTLPLALNSARTAPL